MGSETTLFLRQLISNPRQISAISPSSPWLARAMTAGLRPGVGSVVEFGPGTGRLTAAILARGIAPHALTLFEMNPDFVRHLRARYPGVTVHSGPAQLATGSLPAQSVAKVISGLPLLSMPLPLREDIVKAAFAILAPGGPWCNSPTGQRRPCRPKALKSWDLRCGLGHGSGAICPPPGSFAFIAAAKRLLRRIDLGMQRYAD
jgi:phosphatidylethanolamine/phosphatidyl-N-methylethanolamine N-methyltransferase